MGEPEEPVQSPESESESSISSTPSTSSTPAESLPSEQHGETREDRASTEVIERKVELLARYFAVSHSGPLPPPNTLAGYEKVLPGAAERILSMAEKQAGHRQSLEKTTVRSRIRNEDRGLYLGFLLALASLGVGGYAIHLGQGLVGLAGLVASLATLVIPFVLRRRRPETSKEKAEQDSPPVPPSAPS